MIVVFNIIAITIGLVLLDFVATKLDLIALRAQMSGVDRVGFADPVLKFGEDSAASAAASPVLRVAVLGDSHHQLLKEHGDRHQSPMLHAILSDSGLPNEIISLGTPRYAPIQELVAYETLIKPENDVDVLVFIVYGGNDFLETLRHDDRPRVERQALGTAYIADPHWILQRIPGRSYTSWPRDSRLLYLLNSASPDNSVLKVIVADQALALFDPSIHERLQNILTLWRFTDRRLGYPGAVPAQFLYQYFLYGRYRDIFRDEVRWRLTHFFEECRRLNPDLETYVFFLPSAPAIGALSGLHLRVLDDVLDATGLGAMDFSRLEQEMFELLSEAQDAASAGIELVDLSEPLRRANREDGTRAMYDEPTIHIDVTVDLHRKSGEHQLKQEVFDGTRDQVYGGVQARGGAPGSDQWPATG